MATNIIPGIEILLIELGTRASLAKENLMVITTS